MRSLLELLIRLVLIALTALSAWIVGAEIAKADTIRVAVIDTGFDFDGVWVEMPKLCKEGHKDFTSTSIKDTHGHGTHIAGLVASYAGKADYCLVIIKYFDEKSNGQQNLARSIAAIRYAKELKVDFINYSGGGVLPSKAEKEEVVSFLDQGGQFIAAAGNEGENLDYSHFYPANYDPRVVVVGGVNDNGERVKSSNYGDSVDMVVTASNVLSTLPNGRYGYMTGTSQATAKVTGFLVLKRSTLTVNRKVNSDN